MPAELKPDRRDSSMNSHWTGNAGDKAWSRWLQQLTRKMPDTSHEASRIRTVERNLGLPIRAFLLVFLGYQLLVSPWFDDLVLLREAHLEVVQLFFVLYLVLTVVGGMLLAAMDRLPLAAVRQTVLVLCLLDALFLGALTVVTGGFDSILFWVFLMLVVRTALSTPHAGRQILLNLFVTGCYLSAGTLEGVAQRMEWEILDPATQAWLYPEGIETPTEPVLFRVTLLLLMTACCYGVEVSLDKQRLRRLAEEESRESASRQQQLEAAGRLAAEIAHQLKNPLAIINNAAFTLQRTVREGKTITQQIRIIRDEVGRSDRIITELMGYAQLVEGRVERLDVVEEIEQALRQVFPPAVEYAIEIRRDYRPPLAPLLMQRSHLSIVLVNLFQNARETLDGHGIIEVAARTIEGPVLELRIRDNGPGIPEDQVDRIFEPYYTTKEKGSGLGLAIVKHNTELYGGTVRAESRIGQGTCFILGFPARTVARLRQ
jgi:signal transduction histidine kinase